MTKREVSMLLLLVKQDSFWEDAEEILNLPSQTEKELEVKHQALLEVCELMRTANQLDERESTECPFKFWRTIKPRYDVLVAALRQIDSALAGPNLR